MGKNAERVQTYLTDRLSESVPETNWKKEYSLGGTHIDVAGETDDDLVPVELEWRRADPADNTAKIFRHASGRRDENKDVCVFQLFTLYYELSGGGVSSKRKNAEFVGETAAKTLGGFEYVALTLDILPPKRGAELPEGWSEVVDEVAEEIDERLRQ